MRRVLDLVNQLDPALMIEGEMQADSALVPRIRNATFPNSSLDGVANLLIMPDLDAANITFNILKALGGGVSVGPLLLDCPIAAHIVTPITTVRGLLNMTAVAAARVDKEK